jgi:carbonic anhydrase
LTGLDADVRQLIARLKANPFALRTDRVRDFVFNVDTGLLHEVT